MMKHYIEVKRQNPDKLLMYRLGDFYELFFDDAVTASRELELVLTGRDCGLPERAPMCGVPYHAVDGYISRLVEKGYKVVVCEQMEDPAKAIGLVKRDIVRIITPGTLTDTDVLEAAKNNYVCCLYCDKDAFGLCFSDISTGEVKITEARASFKIILSEFARYEPKEVLLNSEASGRKEITAYLDSRNVSRLTLSDKYFSDKDMENVVKGLFPEKEIIRSRILKRKLAASSLYALLRYIRETQFSGIKRICSIEYYNCSDYLRIPESCSRNLELTQTMRGGEKRGSLLWAMDKTATPMGRRMLRSFLEKPLIDVKNINERLDAVEEFYNNSVLSGQIADSLDGVYDIERLMTRIIYDKCTPRDMVSLASTSTKLSQIKALSSSFHAPLLKKLASMLDPLEDLKTAINTTIADDPPSLLKDGGYIREGKSPEIDELRGLLHNSKAYLAKLEQQIKEKTGIKNIKVGYNKIFGYYFEVSKAQTGLVPDYFIRKQTLTTGERYITEELKDLENKILSAGDRLERLERSYFDDLCKLMTDNLSRVQNTAYAAAYLDVLSSLGELARDNGYTRPIVDDSDEIRIENGRHPVVELVLKNELFVPNNTLLDNRKNLVNIVTGPNMAGKSTYMRQVAVMTIMAQMGSFVPAQYAHIGVVDAVYTRVGASDDLFSGDSTFMVEMKEVAEILNEATSRSLVILDEIGRGTSTYDGMSIARSVVEYICRDGGIGCKTMFATHYHELTDIDADFENVKNYNIAAKKKNDTVVFLRRIVEGPADDSYGIEVAQLAGVPAAVTQRAKEILGDLIEQNPDRVERKVVTTKVETEDEVITELKKLHIETLTPIEAMSTLDHLIKMARSREE